MPLTYSDHYRHYQIRSWQPTDREAAMELVDSVLAEFGLTCEPQGSDLDVLAVEEYYWQQGGEFWVVETDSILVGTAGYYPIPRGPRAVEIRKMYLRPAARGQGLGRYLLTSLESTIARQGFQQIWIETASVLKAAVRLYEASGYQPTTGVDTPRCDLIYVKHLASEVA
jgi:putative acetyltransferase